MPPVVSSDHRTPPQLHHPQSPLIPPTTNHHHITHSLPHYKPNPSPLKYWSKKTEGIHCIECNVFFADHSHEVDIGRGPSEVIGCCNDFLHFSSFFFCRYFWNCCPPYLRRPKCKWKCLPSPLSKSWGCSSQSQSENPKVLLMNWLMSGLPCLQLGTSKSLTLSKTRSPRAINAFSVSTTPFWQKSQVYYLQQRPSGDLGARGSGRTNNYRHLVLTI